MEAGASIVNLISGAVVQPPASLSIYSAAKGAVNTFTGAAARESGPNGIRINAVAPGVVLTPGLHSPRMSETERRCYSAWQGCSRPSKNGRRSPPAGSVRERRAPIQEILYRSGPP